MEAFRHVIQPEAMPVTDVFVQPPPSAGGAMIGRPTFIQAGAPAQTGAYAWWDTSTAVLTLWIEDGI